MEGMADLELANGGEGEDDDEKTGLIKKDAMAA